eukprot:5582510-Alexandrium_andersonii.AAC.1
MLHVRTECAVCVAKRAPRRPPQDGTAHLRTGPAHSACPLEGLLAASPPHQESPPPGPPRLAPP